MSGETNLTSLIGSLSASVTDGVYVFATLPDRSRPAGLALRMVFEDPEGTTVIVLKSDAEAHGLEHEFPCRMITLNLPPRSMPSASSRGSPRNLPVMAWAVNPVLGFFHDHLFVPDGREREAIQILARLADTGA